MAGLVGPDGPAAGRRRRLVGGVLVVAGLGLGRVGGLLGRLGLVQACRLVVVGRLGAGGRGGGLAVRGLRLVGGRAAVDRDVGAADRGALGPVRSSASGAVERDDHAVRGVGRAEQLEGDAGVRRRQLLDLVPDVVDGLEAAGRRRAGGPARRRSSSRPGRCRAA